MRLIIDTHALIWFATGHRHLSQRAKRMMSSLEHERFISAASVYELEIKIQRGLLKELHLDAMLQTFADAGAMRELPITWADSLAAADLPLHHLDPFDRILIAQARQRGLTIVTADDAFKAYGVPCIW